MSVNINHPQDDISTDGGNPPALGGQSPLVADNATVSADSSGNVSRWVMSTAAGAAGTEDGANTWAKIGTFTLGTQNNNLASVSLLISTNNVSTDICLVDVVIYQSGGAGINAAAGAGIEVKSLAHQYGMLSHNSFKLTQASAANGSPVDLWVNKNLNYGTLQVIELASIFIDANSYISYNNNAAWQSSTPSGAVTITSDWAGSGTWVPTIIGLTTAGAGTYTTQTGAYQRSGSMVTLTGRITWTAHTGTGNMALGNFPFTSASGTQCAGQLMHGNIAGTGDMAAYIGSGLTYASLYSVALGSAFSNITLDTAGDIIFTLIYKAA